MNNIIAWYNTYLILVAVVSCCLAIINYRELLPIIIRANSEWPRLRACVTDIFWSAADHRVVIPVCVSIASALAHTLCYYIFWKSRPLHPSDLYASPIIVSYLTGQATTILFLDFRVLFNTSKLDCTGVDSICRQGELALSPWVDRVTKFVTFGYVSSQEYVKEQVSVRITELNEILRLQLHGWMMRITLRLIFGFSCWWLALTLGA
ncbi:hypothetical protein [Calycomorphotria hydatis]|uniref:Uncharacterized protein n=1 Tax=Calycomorphotria hydatis TaxID=2528027 RepID=A0A517T661_9PLAN|nr:hypothetical protein [Calycomorphotria hydatis]QDT63854.1 hypothetical protein V22_10790 [Calycomorphotria hydatis]